MMKAALLTLVILALGVPAHAQSVSGMPSSLVPRSSALLSQAPATSGVSEWQRQYDEATKKKQDGKKKMLIGGALFGVGLVVAVAITDNAVDNAVNCTTVASCEDTVNHSETAALVGSLVMIGGAGVSSWGFYEWYSASNKIDQLELQKAAKSTTLFDLGKHQAIGVRASVTPSVQYELHW
jgi:hypothetical protein